MNYKTWIVINCFKLTYFKHSVLEIHKFHTAQYFLLILCLALGFGIKQSLVWFVDTNVSVFLYYSSIFFFKQNPLLEYFGLAFCLLHLWNLSMYLTVSLICRKKAAFVSWTIYCDIIILLQLNNNLIIILKMIKLFDLLKIFEFYLPRHL